MPKRQVFFSFEYYKDNWRAGQVRNMGKVSNDSTFSDNDWESVKKDSDLAITRWINAEMAKRSCIVVLIGSTTSTRKWVKYEIEKAYELGKGIVGIYIHGLKDKYGNQTTKGDNPFYNITTKDGHRLSNYVQAYDTGYVYSTNVYNNIKDKIEGLIEDAIANAGRY
ncbi:MAG: TIR domain-containing protein [Candidatus Cryptobacteroides sp.]